MSPKRVYEIPQMCVLCNIILLFRRLEWLQMAILGTGLHMTTDNAQDGMEFSLYRQIQLHQE